MYLPAKPKVAIVGATGAVGKELLTLIEERKFPIESLDLVASERSKGISIEFMGASYKVHSLPEFNFSTVDLAFFSAGTSVSRVWAKSAADQGALVIDNTNAFRMDPLTPLVVPQVNAHALVERPRSNVIANPNCSTIQMVRALKPIHQRFGLKRVVVSTYQASSGAGSQGIEELRCSTQTALQGYSARSKRFPKPLGFNVVPQIDVFLENGFTLEEQKMVQESRRILSHPSLDVTATAVRVPVMNGHSAAVYVETETAIDLQEAIELLRAEEEMIVFQGETYPTPRFLEHEDYVHVGRLRQHPEKSNGMWLWVVANNLRVGAALNAIQIAEKLVG